MKNQIELQMLYVSRSQGEFEKREYDTLTLSDGIRSYKFKTPKGTDTSGYVSEETKVVAKCKLTNGQNSVAQLQLVSVSVMK